MDEVMNFGVCMNKALSPKACAILIDDDYR